LAEGALAEKDGKDEEVEEVDDSDCPKCGGAVVGAGCCQACAPPILGSLDSDSEFDDDDDIGLDGWNSEPDDEDD
jgi:hypothetical protein